MLTGPVRLHTLAPVSYASIQRIGIAKVKIMSDWERVNPNAPTTCEAPAIDSVFRPVKDRTYCDSPAVLYFLPGGYRGTNGAWAFGAFAVCALHNEENRIYKDD